MATKKAKGRKAPSKKKVTTKRKPPAAKKKVTKRKSKVDENRSIKGYAGLDEHFYEKFPRYHAYQLLIKARNRTMKVSTFLDKIEQLDGVKSRNQARGIVQKLVDKERHCGAKFAAYV